jgi:hypothetical protein
LPSKAQFAAVAAGLKGQSLLNQAKVLLNQIIELLAEQRAGPLC